MITEFLLKKFKASDAAKIEEGEHDEKTVYRLLSDQPRRIQHILGVVERARELTSVLKSDPKFISVLEKASFFHDIGYATGLAVTGYHPLDSALFLARQKVDEEIILAVLFHTGAVAGGKEHPKAAEIYHEILAPQSFLYHALTFCDLRTSPAGDPITVAERIEEICQRYGKDAPAAKNILLMKPELEKSCEAVIAEIGRCI